jgi:hypothetical protein
VAEGGLVGLVWRLFGKRVYDIWFVAWVLLSWVVVSSVSCLWVGVRGHSQVEVFGVRGS